MGNSQSISLLSYGILNEIDTKTFNDPLLPVPSLYNGIRSGLVNCNIGYEL